MSFPFVPTIQTIDKFEALRQSCQHFSYEGRQIATGTKVQHIVDIEPGSLLSRSCCQGDDKH
jgi:hypothetical protein